MTAIDSVQTVQSSPRVPLRSAAATLEYSPLGLQKLLERTGALIRDDGRWYVPADLVPRIAEARKILGLSAKANRTAPGRKNVVSEA
jgi:hypothetical protein